MIKSKQLDWVNAALIRLGNVAVGAVNSINITTALTTALSTAGRGGVSVPLQVSGNENSVGVITTTNLNTVQIQSTATKNKFADTNNNEVYGRITEAAGVYTLSFFTLVNGTETAYTFAATNIDIDLPYRFDAARLPADFAIALNARVISQDPRGGGAVALPVVEQLAVTATNTVSALTKTPNNNTLLRLVVNGETYFTLGGGSAKFSVTGKAITWSAANSGFNLETSDNVIAMYYSFE